MINGTELSEAIGQALNDKLAEMTFDSTPDWCDSRHVDELVAAVCDVLPSAPIDMVLYCPRCCVQHVDAALVETPDFDSMPDAPILGLIAPEDLVTRNKQYDAWKAANWTNPPHRSHLCHSCGFVWRPADVPTNGVAAITTKGKDDSPVLPPVPR